ncbi:MAG: class B sortase [Oscillospiraceae bacterium]|nr:class B sortase [Oscillospiraceae bacterium]
MKRRFTPVLIIIIVVFSAVFCFAGYKLVSELVAAGKEKSAFTELSQLRRRASSEAAAATVVPDSGGEDREQAAQATESEAPETGEEEQLPPEPLPEYLPIYELNSDFFGWLTIEGTDIDYPVVYTPEEPEYYLRRAFDGTYSHSGVPFLDANCRPDGDYFLIYGHNMKNMTMFGQLAYFLEEDFCREHPVINFDTLYEKHEYEVMAVFLTSVDYYTDDGSFHYYEYYDLPDEETFSEYVKQVKQASVCDTGVNASFGDSILVLSTCNYHTEDGRLVVVAREVGK